MVINSDIKRLLDLSQKLNKGHASSLERDEYMGLLLKNNHIKQSQFDDYKNGQNVEAIVQASLVIGGIVLLGYLLSSLTSK